MPRTKPTPPPAPEPFRPPPALLDKMDAAAGDWLDARMREINVQGRMWANDPHDTGERHDRTAYFKDRCAHDQAERDQDKARDSLRQATQEILEARPGHEWGQPWEPLTVRTPRFLVRLEPWSNGVDYDPDCVEPVIVALPPA